MGDSRDNGPGEENPDLTQTDLDDHSQQPASTTVKVPDEFPETKQVISYSTDVPPDAVALYLVGREKPLIIKGQENIIISRHDPGSSAQPTVDLTAYLGPVLGVSRRHAQITISPDGHFLTDLRSTNGTWLNGHKIIPGRPHLLRNGSQIRMGQCVLFVYLSAPQATVDTILLAESEEANLVQFRQGLSVDYFVNKVSPFLKTLAAVQRVIDETKTETPGKVRTVGINSIRFVSDKSRIEVTLINARDAIQFAQNEIGQLREKYHAKAIPPPTKLLTEEGNMASALTPTPDASPVQSTASTNATEIHLDNHDDVTGGRDEIPPGLSATYLLLVPRMLKKVAPQLSDADSVMYAQRIVPDLHFLVASGLEIFT